MKWKYTLVVDGYDNTHLLYRDAKNGRDAMADIIRTYRRMGFRARCSVGGSEYELTGDGIVYMFFLDKLETED